MNNEKSHPHSTADEALEKAVEHLHQAEDDLKAAQKLEEFAEKKIHEAEAEIDGAIEDHRDDVLVRVTHVNDLESTEFTLSIHATLQAVLDEAYEKLEIKPQPKDVFQTASEHPVSLMSHLALTLDEARKRGVIKDFQFQIVSETGGA